MLVEDMSFAVDPVLEERRTRRRILFIGKKRSYAVKRPGRKGDWHEELFREELARQHEVTFWGKFYTGMYDHEKRLGDVIDMMVDKPEFVLISYDEPRVPGFNDVDVPKVCITAPYFEGFPALDRYHEWFAEHRFDLYFGTNLATVEYLEGRMGGKAHWLPFHVDVHRLRKLAVPKTIDVSAIFSARRDFYDHRRMIKHLLRASKRVRAFTGHVHWDAYVEAINRSRMCLNENMRFKLINPRANEVMACGTLFVTDWNREFELLGYREGEHLVTYESVEELMEKIDYYLEHEDEREAIAAAGAEFVRDRFDMRRRVRSMAGVVERELL